MSDQAEPIGAEGVALAHRFHEIYERRAPEFGYETRADTRAFDPSTPNGRLMIAVCTEIAATRTPNPKAAGVEREAVAFVKMIAGLTWSYGDNGEHEWDLSVGDLVEGAKSALRAVDAAPGWQAVWAAGELAGRQSMVHSERSAHSAALLQRKRAEKAEAELAAIRAVDAAPGGETLSQRQAREVMMPGFGSAKASSDGQSYGLATAAPAPNVQALVEADSLPHAALEFAAYFRHTSDALDIAGVIGAAQVLEECASALRNTCSVWRPIAELTNIYQQPLWIASPKLIHGDANPLGVAEAYWQDTTGPEEGEWRTTEFDMCNDEWNTITLAKEDVTHFLIPTGPWSPEDLERLETEEAASALAAIQAPAGEGVA